MSTENSNPLTTGGQAEAVASVPVVPTTEPTDPVNAAPESSAEASSENGENFSDMDFGEILEQHERESHLDIGEGEVVKGTVVKITGQDVIINVGFKSEGIVKIAEF